MTPIFQTSANRSGDPAPRSFDEIDGEILDQVDVAIDAGQLIGEPSTVLDIAGIDQDGEWSILREGAVSAEAVTAALS